MPPPSALRTLLSGAIDYAGLFPPAELDLPTALANYQAYRGSPDSWALGRFVVPVARLGELRALLSPVVGSGCVLPLAALLGTAAVAELDAVGDFNRASASHGARVESIELKSGTEAGTRTVLAGIPPQWSRYLEVPIEPASGALLALVAAGGAFAKVRTGGTAVEAFPAPDRLLEWLATAARLRVPFKATAGLHHPLRGSYRLTYAEAAPSAVMFGYLNLLLAAAVLWRGGDLANARAVLLEEDPKALRISAGCLAWRGLEFEEDQLADLRARFVHGFGSCSFREPLDELAAWGWQ